VTEAWFYKPADYYILDDISGFKVRRSRARKIPGGQTGNLIVETKRWEAQHPQDFVRGIYDDQTVPEARPRQPNQFVIVATWVTAKTPRQEGVITVDSVAGFNLGDRVYVMLDSGEPYYPVVYYIAGNQLWLTPPLPVGVGGPYNDFGMTGNYGDPLENVVIDLGPSGLTTIPVLGTDVEQFILDDAGDFISATT